MRVVLGLLLVLFATPSIAADWGHYENARFGYAIDVPPGFVAGPEADGSDGLVLKTPTASLTVWGENIGEGDFEAAVRQRQDYAAQDGWNLTYQVTTPSKASFSGKNGGHILYARMVALCGGRAFAMFELEYGVADMAKFDAVVSRLVGSFTSSGSVCQR